MKILVAKKSFSNKRATKVLLVFIALLIAISVPIAMVRKVSADQYDDEIAMETQNIAQYQAQADILNKAAITLQNTLDQLANQEAAIQAQINISQAKYDQLVIRITETEKQIKDNQNALGKTIASMYVDDRITPLEMLASSSSIGDFLDKQEYRSSVRSQLTSTIVKIKDLKKQLDQQRIDIKVILDKQQTEKASLVSSQSQKKDLLNRTNGDEAAYQQLIGNSMSKIAEARALQEALKRKGESTGGYSIFDNGLSSEYITDKNFGSWNDYNCPMGGYIDNQWIEYASTLGSNGNGGDGHGFGCRQCASYVAWRIGKETTYYPSGIGADGWGDAYSFTGKAKQAPWNGVETPTPHKGSVAVLGNSAPGHVAWVETDPYINDKGQNVIQVSQYNWNYGQGYGMYSRMELSVNFFDHYIQIVK